MKKVIKNINIIFIVAILCFFCSALTVQAATIGDNLISNITSGAESLEEMGETKASDWGITVDDISEIFGSAQILWFIGIATVDLIGTTYLAYKYSHGEPGDKSSVKKILPVWIGICFVTTVPWVVVELVASIRSLL